MKTLATMLLCVGLFPAAHAAGQTAQSKIEDIGGVFIFANAPKELAEWYKDKLGIELDFSADDKTYTHLFHHGSQPWAFTAFSIHPAKGPLPADRNQVILNFRTDDFDGLITRLKRKGVIIERTQDLGYGRFGWIKDSEGNQIEFWQAGTPPK